MSGGQCIYRSCCTHCGALHLPGHSSPPPASPCCLLPVHRLLPARCLPAAVNGWFMRPGSSVVELTAYGFDEQGQHIQYAARNHNVRGCCCWWRRDGEGAARPNNSPAGWGSGNLGPAPRSPGASPDPLRRPALPHLVSAAPRPAPLQDEASQVQYWNLMHCGNDSWTPGDNEVAGLPPVIAWPKNRDLRVR